MTAEEVSQPTVLVYCAERSHEDDPYVIAYFGMEFRDRNGESIDEIPDDPKPGSVIPAWVVLPRLPLAGNLPDLKVKGWRNLRASLAGDRYVPSAEYKKDPFVFDSGSRSRYNFRCARCGLALARKAEPVHSMLDRLVAAGVSTLSLSAMAAIV